MAVSPRGRARERRSALFTDLYELTMAQGYFLHGIDQQAVFDMFFRREPFRGSLAVFAGLGDLIDQLEGLRFEPEDIAYLESLGYFQPPFLEYLREFTFSGELYAMDEGSVVFPQEPLLRVHTNMIEAQIIEGMVLNTINFQTLIATKAARVKTAAGDGTVVEFGLRRAQGWDGALAASRAAYIGGAAATSNTLAGRMFGIPVSGTMAHSWVMAFDSELEAFEKYADLYPERSVLLIDTYDTLDSGLPNAITVGKRLQAAGHSFGIRLDSGDIEYLSCRVREGLDAAGLHEAKIAVSNELTEEIIEQLVSRRVPVDLWGVGTNLVTGGEDASLTGVYKLAAKQYNSELQPTMKLSDNPAKTSNPGVKQVYRFFDRQGEPIADLIAFDYEQIPESGYMVFYHPQIDSRWFTLKLPQSYRAQLSCKMQAGRRVAPEPSLPEIQRYAAEELGRFDDTYKRIINPHLYKVSLSQRMRDTKQQMISGFLERYERRYTES